MFQKNRSFIFNFFILGALCGFTSSVHGAPLPGVGSSIETENPQNPNQKWEDWVGSESVQSETSIVQNRAVSKSGRVQLVGPLVGMDDRRDFYTTYVFSLGARYHFNENHAWEFFRFSYNLSKESPLVTEIRERTSYQPDVQLSRFQIGTSYVYTPVYGKYAWGSDHLIYFDIFGTLGGGLRFAQDSQGNASTQPFGEFGIGMNHYIFSRQFSIVPEFRERIYAEQRSGSVVVFEGIFQLGMAWLL